MDDAENRFTELYDACYQRVFGYALTRVEQEAAEDVVSETFLIAWRRLVEVPEPPLPWLLGVARNLLHKQYDRGRRGRLLTERISALTTPADLSAWDVADHVIERESALAAIATLSEADLETLALISWHGLDLQGAATVVNCSTATFQVRLHRARRRLSKALEATIPFDSRVMPS